MGTTACTHSELVRWMRHCPRCGDAAAWPAEHGNPVCDACSAPSHDVFNGCWSCGESFGERHAPRDDVPGYALEYDCDAPGCAGGVAWLMPFCPWCTTPQAWTPSKVPDAPACLTCEAALDPTWDFCATCGEEAPLPDDCVRCGTSLGAAEAAARCEHCRRWVCDGCFGEYALASGDALLCGACADALGAAPALEADATEEADAAEASEEAGADEAEPSEEESGEAAAAGKAPPPPPPPRAEPPRPSPWEVLGVAPGTPLPEVKRAYLTLVAQYHPDKVAQLGPKLQALALEETRKLNDAFAELRERAGRQRAS